MGCTVSDAAQPHEGFTLYDMPVAMQNTKCPFNHEDRLFRTPSSGSSDVTVEDCYEQCVLTAGCKHFSYGAWQGAFVCMGCTVSDEAHTHQGFTLYDMPGCGGTYEAENAARLEGALVHAQTDSVGFQGFRGQSFVDYLTADGSIQWNIEHCGAHAASVSFRYALRTGDRPLRVEVNGEVVQAQLSFPRTGSWATWGRTAQVEIRLVAGANSIRLVGTGSSGANVDSMTLTMEPET